MWVCTEKNAWVDGTVMKKLADNFMQEKQEQHGDDWVILYVNNLSAHLLPEVKQIFGDGYVLLLVFPPK